MDNAEMEELVKRSAAALAEHFDTVQIFVTRHDGGNEITQSYETGRGNFYTRYGQITEWTQMQDQFQRNEAIRRDAKRD